MKSKHEKKGQFIIGFLMITISLICLFVKLFYKIDYIEIGIFVFGVMGGVELGGRYVGQVVNNTVNGE